MKLLFCFKEYLTAFRVSAYCKYRKLYFALCDHFNNNSLKQTIIMDTDGDSATKKFSATFFLAMLCTTVILFSCNIKRKWIDVDPAFSKYIEAYTSGIVSKTASFKIQLAADAATTHAVGEEVSQNLFDFSQP